MGDTTIEWTEKTWNPTRGCSLVSPGCTNCYAMGQAHRFSGKGKPFEGLTKKRVKLGVVWTGKVRLAPDMLALPLSWKKPQRVFVNSMSDLFHEELSNEEIAAVFGVMAAAHRHTFQVLTKRAKRMCEWFEWVGDDRSRIVTSLWPYQRDGFVPSVYFREGEPVFWPLPNVWLGVSAEDQQRAGERIPELLRTPATVRFVSYEPALGPIDVAPFLPPKLGTCDWADTGRCHHSLANSDAALDWIIVGGESGPRAREFNTVWAKSVVDACKDAGVACFVKQLGAKPFDGHGHATPPRLVLKNRKGGDVREWPASLRVREFPEVRT